jgi:hypothetical protein
VCLAVHRLFYRVARRDEIIGDRLIHDHHHAVGTNGIVDCSRLKVSMVPSAAQKTVSLNAAVSVVPLSFDPPLMAANKLSAGAATVEARVPARRPVRA